MVSVTMQMSHTVFTHGKFPLVLIFFFFLKQSLNVSHKWILPNCFSEKINESFLALATKGCIQRKT